MCDDPQHTCSICSHELSNLIVKGREEETFSRRYRERPLGFNHSSIRFGDRSVTAHHDLYINGELATEGAFEFQLGEQGWLARFTLHGSPPRREVHRVHDSKGLDACHEVLYGHVQLILKPHHARWLALIERHYYDLDMLAQQAQNDDIDGLILTTGRDFWRDQAPHQSGRP